MSRTPVGISLVLLAAMHLTVGLWFSVTSNDDQNSGVVLTVDEWCDFLGKTACAPIRVNNDLYELQIEDVEPDTIYDLLSASHKLSGWATYGFKVQRTGAPNSLLLTLQLVATER